MTAFAVAFRRGSRLATHLRKSACRAIPSQRVTRPVQVRLATSDANEAKASSTVSSLFASVQKEALEKAGTSTDSTKDIAPKSVGRLLTKGKGIPTFSTGDFRVSPRKLVHLARLIRGMPLEEAEVQMQMSKKRPADRVRAMLHRTAASLKHNYAEDPKTFVVQQAWVGKGVYLKRLKIHGRARFGIMHRPAAHLKIVVAKKKLDQTKEEKEFDRLVRMFRKHSLYVTMRNDRPVRSLHPPWSSKPWKYVTSKKWMSPDNALAKYR
ncbi:hypothetical protein PhCBS80983_g00344 [Powellomyces hirtus]|uniref:Ribosomal protein L22 n=1 Tax=Powellomyces hirtus TaxID=109895 RepID=A0A507EFL3_9FUNG|nr:hypothetical protein PhCBS80983_g00344 [Powellomyces hirtus]